MSVKARATYSNVHRHTMTLILSGWRRTTEGRKARAMCASSVSPEAIAAKAGSDPGSPDHCALCPCSARSLQWLLDMPLNSTHRNVNSVLRRNKDDGITDSLLLLISLYSSEASCA